MYIYMYIYIYIYIYSVRNRTYIYILCQEPQLPFWVHISYSSAWTLKEGEYFSKRHETRDPTEFDTASVTLGSAGWMLSLLILSLWGSLGVNSYPL